MPRVAKLAVMMTAATAGLRLPSTSRSRIPGGQGTRPNGHDVPARPIRWDAPPIFLQGGHRVTAKGSAGRNLGDSEKEDRFHIISQHLLELGQPSDSPYAPIQES